MFHSRDKRYKFPSGAINAEESVHLRVSLPRDFECSACNMIVELDGGETTSHDMFWCGMNGDFQEWWECDFTPEVAGLYFYRFELRTPHGSKNLYRGHSDEAVLEGMNSWQLTVCNKDFSTPDWLEGGIFYQIFPDRFHKSNKEKTGVPEYRRLHENWNEEVQWWPNEDGVIDNCDFFGGDLQGIIEKLPYIKSLGTTCIYLNPIFEAYSNHGYDTADYSKIDPLLGTNEDFEELCAKAKEMGISIIIDGVFSHTGSDSIYFNKYNHYDSVGAYNSQESQYYPWYSFSEWPNHYDSWWNFDTLPNVNETNPAFNEYINGENGIVRKWIKAGASGWRLDVADELPDEFIDNLTKAAKAERPDGVVLGEVWEDASTKSAYGVRRRYLLGGQLDSVMNYPFRQAILDYLMIGNPHDFFESIERIVESYPPQVTRLLMNHISNHDTMRAITKLAGEPLSGDRQWQSEQMLTTEQKELGVKRMKLAALLQYTLPGIPCLYYGDEAGVEGYKDPFNRRTFPWSKENAELYNWYKALGEMRHAQKLLQDADFERLWSDDEALAFARYKLIGDELVSLTVILNRGDRFQSVPQDLIDNKSIHVLGADLAKEEYELSPYSCSIYSLKRKATEEENDYYKGRSCRCPQ